VEGENFGPDECDAADDYDLTDPIMKNENEPASQSQEASEVSQGKYSMSDSLVDLLSN